MRNLVLTLAMILLGALAQQMMPWWSIWLAGLVVGFFITEGGAAGAFSVGFLGAALLWGLAAFWLNSQNGGIMAGRIGQLFGGLSPFMLVLLTAVFGGMAGGLGSLSGHYGKQLIQRI